MCVCILTIWLVSEFNKCVYMNTYTHTHGHILAHTTTHTFAIIIDNNKHFKYIDHGSKNGLLYDLTYFVA